MIVYANLGLTACKHGCVCGIYSYLISNNRILNQDFLIADVLKYNITRYIHIYMCIYISV